MNARHNDHKFVIRYFIKFCCGNTQGAPKRTPRFWRGVARDEVGEEQLGRVITELLLSRSSFKMAVVR
jgi:hypothetical protein